MQDHVLEIQDLLGRQLVRSAGLLKDRANL
jgi:hypothetical protein